jgi:SCP-2 sterol transfer family
VTQNFFERLLPHMCAQRIDDFFGFSGTIAFNVKGEGDWTFTFANPEPIAPGFDEKADLRMWFTPTAFGQFVDGSLDAVAAITQGEVKAKGNVELLGDLGILMQPAQKDLGWDAGG